MKRRIKAFLLSISKTKLGPTMLFCWETLAYIQLYLLCVFWYLCGAKRPSKDQRERVCENITFVFKSFERQRLAKRLYKNIQRYYPGVNVIIVDDSRKPLNLTGPNLQVIQMPFNSGLSAGLNEGLSRVKTPFVVRMDDDELLTPHSNFHKQLEFLLAHSEIDLVGILPMKFPTVGCWKKWAIDEYKKFTMANAPKRLTIPHGTIIDEDHIIFGKVPNIFVARTEKYRALGYDSNIRMIDHHEFFYRAAGNLVSALDPGCYVAHIHCPFDSAYQVYRNDILGDKWYIAQKHPGYFPEKKRQRKVEET